MAKKTSKPVNCIFVSEWDDDITIRSKALYHPDTGEVHVLETADVGDLNSLTREFIVINEGTDQEDELEVCTTCHEYVMRAVMVPGVARHSLEETTECSNPDCESKF